MTDYRTPLQRRFDALRATPGFRRTDAVLAMTVFVVFGLVLVAALLGQMPPG